MAGGVREGLLDEQHLAWSLQLEEKWEPQNPGDKKGPAGTSTPIPHVQVSTLKSGLGVLACQSSHITMAGWVLCSRSRQTEEVPAGCIFVKLK